MDRNDLPCDDSGETSARKIDADQRVVPTPSTGDVTRILAEIEQGKPQKAEQLLPLVYEELRKLAAAKMAQEKPGQTLQATALVHEAYVRLVDVEQAQHWDSRAISSPLRPRPCDGFWWTGPASGSRRNEAATASAFGCVSQTSRCRRNRTRPSLWMRHWHGWRMRTRLPLR